MKSVRWLLTVLVIMTFLAAPLLCMAAEKTGEAPKADAPPAATAVQAPKAEAAAEAPKAEAPKAEAGSAEAAKDAPKAEAPAPAK